MIPWQITEKNLNKLKLYKNTAYQTIWNINIYKKTNQQNIMKLFKVQL